MVLGYSDVIYILVKVCGFYILAGVEEMTASIICDLICGDKR